jgi:hypothetical protein
VLFAACIAARWSTPNDRSVSQSRVAAISHADLFALAALSGYWRDAGMGTDGVIVALAKRARGFRHEDAADDPTNARQGPQHGGIAKDLRRRGVPLGRTHLIY